LSICFNDDFDLCIAGLSSPAVERWILGIEQSGELVMLEALKDSDIVFCQVRS